MVSGLEETKLGGVNLVLAVFNLLWIFEVCGGEGECARPYFLFEPFNVCTALIRSVVLVFSFSSWIITGG